MSQTYDFNIENLEQFLKGIDKLSKTANKFVSMGDMATGRSKAAKDFRAEQLLAARTFNQLLNKTSKMYRLIDRSTSVRMVAENKSIARKARMQDLEFKKRDSDTRRALRLEDMKTQKIIQREKALSKLESYGSMTSARMSRKSGESGLRVSELERRSELRGGLMDKRHEQRMEEFAEKRSSKRWDKFEKMAWSTVIAPFKIMGGILQSAWDSVKYVVGKALNLAKWGAGGALGLGVAGGALVNNIAGKTFGARAQGVNVLSSEYLAAALKGVIGDVPGLLSGIAGLKASPLDIAYPAFFGKGSALGMSPSAKTEDVAIAAAEYAFKASQRLGQDILLARTTDQILQQFTPEQLLAFTKMKGEEFYGPIEKAKQGYGLKPTTTEAITEFDRKLGILGTKIKGYFAEKLVPAFAPLERLFDSFVGLFDNILTEDKINKAVTYLTGQLDKFSAWLGNDETQKEFEKVWNGVTETLVATWKSLNEVDWNKLIGLIGSFGSAINETVNAIYGTLREYGFDVRASSAKASDEAATAANLKAQGRTETNIGNKFTGALGGPITLRQYTSKEAQSRHRKMVRAHAWSKLTQKYATKEIPASVLEAVIAQESGGDPSAVSWAGAAGLAQFMPGTAKQYGVEDRFDPEQSVKGESKYLNHLYSLFKSKGMSDEDALWHALSSYNAGEGNVQKWRAGGKGLPIETQKYTPSVLQYQKDIESSYPGNPSLMQDLTRGRVSQQSSLGYPNRNVAITITKQGMASDTNVSLSNMPGAVNGGAALSNAVQQIW